MRPLLPPFLVLLALAGVGLAPAPALAGRVHGAIILDEVREIEPGRYISKKNWAKTLRFFRTVYGKTKGVLWRDIPTNTQVAQAKYIENTAKNRTWEGINLYESGGKVYIYVIKADDASRKGS